MQVADRQKIEEIWKQNENARKEANKDGPFLRELRKLPRSV
jgi:hypothetical protein